MVTAQTTSWFPPMGAACSFCLFTARRTRGRFQRTRDPARSSVTWPIASCRILVSEIVEEQGWPGHSDVVRDQTVGHVVDAVKALDYPLVVGHHNDCGLPLAP